MLLLLMLGAAPEVLVTPLQSASELAARHPCPKDAAPAFCVGPLKVVVHHEPRQLVSRLEVTELATGKKVYDESFLGSLALVGDRLYFWKGFELWFLVPSSPGKKPEKASQLDCGTEGSPYAPAVVNGRGTCFIDSDEGVLRLSTGIENDESPDCKVPLAARKKTPAGFSIRAEKLSKACSKLLLGK